MTSRKRAVLTSTPAGLRIWPYHMRLSNQAAFFHSGPGPCGLKMQLMTEVSAMPWSSTLSRLSTPR
jgi:hypothetical protein